jgi:hypothetical protein
MRRKKAILPKRLSNSGITFIIVLAAFFQAGALGAEGAKAAVDFILHSASDGEKPFSWIISELDKAAEGAETLSDRRSILVVLGSMQERAGHYRDAARSYEIAAGIAALAAPGMPRVLADRLVIDAVRCRLSVGDYEIAESHLSSAVKNSGDPAIQAYIKLYTAWCLLSKAQTDGDLAAAVALLEAYAKDSALEVVRPAALLTLWYIDSTDARRDALASRYPNSPEAAIAQGKANILPSPFWFFLRQGSPRNQTPTPSAEGQNPPPGSRPLLQLGFFRNRGNAEAFVSQLKKDGFEASILTQNRNGQDFFVVTMVDSGDTLDRLRAARIDAIPMKNADADGR